MPRFPYTVSVIGYIDINCGGSLNASIGPIAFCSDAGAQAQLL
jgi:hypothetical protein